MTREEFLVALSACASRYAWAVDENFGWLRGHKAGYADDTIEGYVCPLIAVAHTRFGASEDYSLHNWPVAASDLDLCAADASNIIVAADDRTFFENGLASLRHQMLAAVGLEAKDA